MKQKPIIKNINSDSWKNPKIIFICSFLLIGFFVLNSKVTQADNSQCNSMGTGYIYNGTSCVLATNFSCSTAGQTCPTNMMCVVPDGQCEETCSSAKGSSVGCDLSGSGQLCNGQGYCTAGGQPTNTESTSIATPAPTPVTQTPAVTTQSSNNNTTLYNPLPENDLTHVFLLITKSFLGIIGIWAVMFIIFGGFQMVTASGNEEAYEKAKKTITWAVLGLAVALLSFSIIAIVEDLLQANISPPTATTPANSIPSTPANSIPNTTPGN